MTFRIPGLAGLDPTQVPLPHGTEVSTRVDRAHGQRVVPQGAVGRVVGIAGDRLTVRIIGVGDLIYARSELLPRKAGQIRYAQRRAIAWDALLPCVVLEATVGSRAWGLADRGSDTDVRGAFALPFSWTAGLLDPPQDLVSADASTSYWEVKKLVRQALAADPNTLELLFAQSARPRDPIGQWLLEEREAFVSKEIYASFGRYALSQLKKLSQSLRLAEHRALVLAWLREDPAPTLDEVSARLARAAVNDAPSEGDARLRAKEYVKQLYRSLYDQGLIAERELAALVRFAREDPSSLELPRELRPKNAYNLLRLIRTAIDWLDSGTPTFRLSGAFREELLAIKRGEVPLEVVLARAEELAPELEAARNRSALPGRPDLGRADALLRRIQEELARRWLAQGPGPFGAGAPPVPELAEEDRDDERPE